MQSKHNHNGSKYLAYRSNVINLEHFYLRQ
jgi:hypothetical protein